MQLLHLPWQWGGASPQTLAKPEEGMLGMPAGLRRLGRCAAEGVPTHRASERPGQGSEKTGLLKSEIQGSGGGSEPRQVVLSRAGDGFLGNSPLARPQKG